jgi:hypothetical protein
VAQVDRSRLTLGWTTRLNGGFDLEERLKAERPRLLRIRLDRLGYPEYVNRDSS